MIVPFSIPFAKVLGFKEKPCEKTKLGMLEIDTQNGDSYSIQIFGDMYWYWHNHGRVGDYISLSGVIRSFVMRDGITHTVAMQPRFLAILKSYFIAPPGGNAKTVQEIKARIKEREAARKERNEAARYIEGTPPELLSTDDFDMGE